MWGIGCRHTDDPDFGSDQLLNVIDRQGKGSVPAVVLEHRQRRQSFDERNSRRSALVLVKERAIHVGNDREETIEGGGIWAVRCVLVHLPAQRFGGGGVAATRQRDQAPQVGLEGFCVSLCISLGQKRGSGLHGFC